MDHCLGSSTQIKAVSRASCNTGHVSAGTILLPTGNSDARPGPVRATRATARDDHIVAAARDRSGTDNILDGQIGDGDATRGSTSI